MSTFSLPKIPYRSDIYHLFDITTCESPPILLNKTLSKYLSKIKSQIDSRQDDWDRWKKLTNPYEYIHTSVPNSKQAVCRLKPLSRSFYKMIEIYNLMDFVEYLKYPCKIFYLAEGPGGFIEAMTWLRDNPHDKHYAISLVDDNDTSVPGWKKSQNFLDKHPNINIEFGMDGIGNLLNPETYLDCFNRHKNSVDIVTGDGGFNFAFDFNHQEIVSTQLIFCQIAYAVSIQRQGGVAIIKFFDTFTAASLDLVYFLMIAYSEVTWVKPCTSRYANSERYAVCKNFRLKGIDEIVKLFYQILKNMAAATPYQIDRLFNNEIPYLIVNKIEEYNAMFGQQQIESINNTLGLITNSKYDKIDSIKKANIGKCISWCQRYKLPYNKVISTTNVFLGNRQNIQVN